MDEYHRAGKGWGRGERRETSRAAKAQMRLEVRREAQAAQQPTRFIEIGGAKLWLDPKQPNERGDDAEFIVEKNSPCKCDGCDSDIRKTGWFPWCYAGDVIECVECVTRYFVQENR